MRLRTIRVFLAAVAASLLLASPLVVHAQGGVAQDGPEDPMSIYKQAGVNQEQEIRIRQLAKEFEEGANVRARTRINLMRQMHELSLTAEPDEKAVLSKQDEINVVNSQMGTERVRLLLKIRALLSKEQKEKLVALMRERSAQRGQ